MSSATFSKFGKGLFGESKSETPKKPQNQENLIKIEASKLHPSPYQPRTEFDAESLQELADSIRKNGIIQPIVARARAKGDFEIIAGERRWRAAKMLGLEVVPVIIRQLTDRDCMEMALVENIQRRDLSPLEEAQAYRRLLGEFGYTQDDLARTVGKSRSHVANILRLLTLPDTIKQMVKNGSLSMGHARAILAAESPEYVAQKVVEQKLSVRETEELIQDIQAAKEDKIERIQEEQAQAQTVQTQPAQAQTEQKPSSDPTKDQDEFDKILKRAEAINAAEEAIQKAIKNVGLDPDEIDEIYNTPKLKDPDIIALEDRLTKQLGCKVQIKTRGKRGEVRIKYKSLDQLDGILQLIDQEKTVA